jgi:nitric oxide reductase NorQ protein
MQRNDALQVLQNGAATKQEIADELGEHPNTVDHHLKALLDEDDIDRERDGRSYVYFIPEPEAEADTEADSEDEHYESAALQTEQAVTAPVMENDLPDSVPPVQRDYDWETMVPRPEETHEYIPSDGEWDEINAKVNARHATQQEPAFLLGGPTGCGKTTLAEHMAADRGWPVITLQMTYDMSPASLLGKATVRSSGDGGTETVWNDGPLTKALLASRERPTVLIVDEANRARPEVHSTLMSALDSRCEVTLDQRGGEKIRGVRQNLIVISTINPKGSGDYHGVQDIDFAVKRRLSNAGRYNVNYLGMNYPQREADVLTDRTPAGARLADLIVETANQVREQAEDPTSEVRSGIPTSSLISVCQSAYALSEAGMDDAVLTAFETDIVDALYDQRENERNTVQQIAKDNLDGCPFSEDDVAAWTGDVEYVSCQSCSYRATSTEAENEGVLDFMECPDCAGHVTYE